MPNRIFFSLLLCTAVAAQSVVQTAAQEEAQITAAPKAQIAPDQKAFNMARATTDPSQELAALRQFVKEYPHSTRKGSAQSLILTTLLDHFPERTKDVDDEARLRIKGDKGFIKWSSEAETALRMAAAEPAGADLTRAREFADDALRNETEPKVTKAMLVFFKKPETPPTPAVMHTFYTDARATAFVASAFISFREGKLAEASAQANEAYRLAPLDVNVNECRGLIAYAQHRNTDALTAFERAQVSGALTKANRALFAKLFADANPAGNLETTLDARYRELYPEPFHPAAHAPTPGGHTVLLELYTGSGCPPCVGGDLAVEALIKTRPRTELVVLVYDLHIPKPDPLTSRDTVARAAWYKISQTPTYVVDGKVITTINGGPREAAEEIYGKLARSVDAQTAKPSAVRLQLSPTMGGSIGATATVSLPELAALAQPTSPMTLPDPDAHKPAAAPGAAAQDGPAITPHYLLNFALVEDDVRYAGENGVRFHRMVVRALAKTPGTGLPLTPGQSVTLTTAFDPAAIAAASRDYLDNFAKANERFGPIEFLAKPTAIDPAQLAIAAWVQDADTRRVLQSAFLPLTPAAAQGGTR